MILCDWHIARALIDEKIGISPLMDVDPSEYNTNRTSACRMVVDSTQIQPSSVDLRLSDEFIRFDSDFEKGYLDPDEDNSEYGETVHNDEYYLSPGEFILGNTVESVSIPDDMRATLQGRSSWGRLAIVPHVEAGYIDAGYHGNITLEITNLGEETVRLPAGRRFCQIEFAELSGKAYQPYDSKYQGQEDVTPSRLHEDTV